MTACEISWYKHVFRRADRHACIICWSARLSVTAATEAAVAWHTPCLCLVFPLRMTRFLLVRAETFLILSALCVGHGCVWSSKPRPVVCMLLLRSRKMVMTEKNDTIRYDTTIHGANKNGPCSFPVALAASFVPLVLQAYPTCKKHPWEQPKKRNLGYSYALCF